jgi:hypothetical protein
MLPDKQEHPQPLHCYAGSAGGRILPQHAREREIVCVVTGCPCKSRKNLGGRRDLLLKSPPRLVSKKQPSLTLVT